MRARGWAPFSLAVLLTVTGALPASAPVRAEASPQAGVGPAVASPSSPATTPDSVAIDPEAFAHFLLTLRDDAVAAGIAPSVAGPALDGLEPLPIVVTRDRTQAESLLTIDDYVRRRLTPRFVRAARQMAARHRRVLARVERQYGVPARVLVAIWAIESNFGRFSGVRPTVQALATLAYEGRRATFFRGELFDALRMIERRDIEPEAMRGSWAGAMGQPQFMPSSYLRHAVDFDGDGRRDIWRSLPDVFASIANYLKAKGWASGVSWGREVRVPATARATLGASRRDAGCVAVRAMSPPQPVTEWRTSGLTTASGQALPRATPATSLVDAGQRMYLVSANYEAVLAYNCAHPYALSVVRLADAIGR